MKKILASYYDAEKGVIVPQREMEMHTLEIKSHLAFQAHATLHNNLPQKPTHSDDLETLISEDVEAVKKKREAWKLAFDAAQPELQKALDNHIQCTSDWHSHIEKCEANGLNPDITPEGSK